MREATTPMPLCELEPPQRRTLASVQVAPDLWWSGAVTVPDDGSGIGLLELTRHSTGEETETTVVVPVRELSVLAVLVDHLATRAMA